VGGGFDLVIDPVIDTVIDNGGTIAVTEISVKPAYGKDQGLSVLIALEGSFSFASLPSLRRRETQGVFIPLDPLKGIDRTPWNKHTHDTAPRTHMPYGEDRTCATLIGSAQF
jgi:hypothetical protein